jgi:hypothetical protein
MTGPAADAERETLGGGDAMSRAVRASDGVELHSLRWCSGRSPPAIRWISRWTAVGTWRIWSGGCRIGSRGGRRGRWGVVARCRW